MRHKLGQVSGKWWVGSTCAVILAAAAFSSAAPAAARHSASTRVPFGFVGMDVDLPVWPNPGIDLSHQLDVMTASGVDSVRAVVDWSVAQPYASWSQVPQGDPRPFVDVGGVPTDFTDLDALVALTAEHGMRLLPVTMNAPSWDATTFRRGIVSIPRSPAPYANFLRALVLRYGPNGTFWPDNPQIPKVPVRMWQIWNEPNVYPFWPQGPKPYYVGYVALLRAAHAAIKQADPRAKVVLAGLPNYSWINLRQIIKHGGRKLFDVAAIHPYTRTPAGVITILSNARRALNQTGDGGKPILADEVSWSSAGTGPGRIGLDIATTPAGQARNIAKLLPMLERDRKRLGLAGFDYYNWAGLERPGGDVFEFTGLFRLSDYQFIAKPAYYAFRRAALAMEGCRAKGSLATECLR
jgi:polysaccharide biosynthesis protein PslG